MHHFNAIPHMPNHRQGAEDRRQDQILDVDLDLDAHKREMQRDLLAKVVPDLVDRLQNPTFSIQNRTVLL